MPAPLITRLAPEELSALPEHQRAMLRYAWDLYARPPQKPPPGDWLTWLYMAGRGAGKTRAAAEWIRKRVVDGVAERIALVGRTTPDVRQIMIEGESGLLSVFPPAQRPVWVPSKRELRFHTGALAITYSSENPEQLRGPSNDTAWVDELASFKTRDAWDELQMTMRRGESKQVVSTTPKPKQILRELIKSEYTVGTHESSYDNRSNLSRAYFASAIRPYEGTVRGQQEIMGMLLDSLPGALWTREMIRYRETPPTTRRVIGVDPSIGDGETSDECGIVGVGLAEDGKLDVLGDWSLRASPLKWARQVVRAYREAGADYIVIERNAGGKALLRMNLDQVAPGLPIQDVWAKESKDQRASNPALKYELGQVFHALPMQDLEDQLCTWIPGEGPSPDRLDALVWAVRSLTTPQFRMGMEVLR